MPLLTAAGQSIVSNAATQHTLPEGAVTQMLIALVNGRGTQAQFNIAELGGMGQWSQGGMTMVGDMFNAGLKLRVASLCADLAGALRDTDVFATAQPAQSQSQSQGVTGPVLTTASRLFAPDPSRPVWPTALGQIGSQGSQNDLHYAIFPATRRLAVAQGDKITVYDTGDHRIGGVSQAQGGGQSVSFTSQHGLIRLSDLPIVDPGAPAAAQTTSPATAVSPAQDDDIILARIEKLAALHTKGILSDDEFSAKKAELLARL